MSFIREEWGVRFCDESPISHNDCLLINPQISDNVVFFTEIYFQSFVSLGLSQGSHFVASNIIVMVRKSVDFYELFISSFEILLIFELTVQISSANEVFFGEVCQYLDHGFFNLVYLFLVFASLRADMRRKNNQRTYNCIASIIIPK